MTAEAHHYEELHRLVDRLEPDQAEAVRAVVLQLVVEVCQLLASRRGTYAEALFLKSISDGELQLLDLELGDYARAAELVQQYADSRSARLTPA